MDTPNGMMRRIKIPFDCQRADVPITVTDVPAASVITVAKGDELFVIAYRELRREGALVPMNKKQEE